MQSSLESPIAQGRTAEVYNWDEQHILKLYREWCPPEWVEYEAAIARTIVAAGIPTPAAGEIIEVLNRRGIIYERAANALNACRSESAPLDDHPACSRAC